MKVVNKIEDLKLFLSQEREKGKHIGLVPTMGALHAGHLSLVKRCVAENDICVVSVFVNPTQFGPTEDLEAYPRDFERDSELCESPGDLSSHIGQRLRFIGAGGMYVRIRSFCRRDVSRTRQPSI